MKRIFTLIFAITIAIISNAQISITANGSAFTQDFNTLANNGTNAITTLPTGWTFLETGTGANTTYTADNGGVGSGNTYSYGTTSATDRSLGTLLSGSVTSTIGASFTNNTGLTINSIAISFIGEQWRLGAISRVDRLDFQYSTNATSLISGTYTAEANLNFTAPVTSGTVGAVDGNAAANRTAVSFTITGLSIASGSTFWIKWNDFNATGSDDGLAIDDFSITTTGGVDIIPPTVSTLNPINNATNVSTNTNLQILFSEPIVKGTGNIVIKKLSDNSTVQTIDVTTAAVTVSGSTATITINPLLNTTDYYVEVTAGAFRDIALNNFAGITGNATWKFTTAAPTLPPAAGILNNTYGFTNCNSTFLSEGWRQYSVTGAQIWNCVKEGRTYSAAPAVTDSGIQMNGYAVSAQLNEDWLISPPFDLTGSSGPYLSFYSRTKYAGNNLILKVSTNYVAGTDPNAATWTTLSTITSSNTDVWTLNNNFDLTQFIGPNVYIAWKYSSTTTAAARWTLDDIIVNAGCTPPSSQPTSLNLTPGIISINGSFAPSAPAADGYLVLMSTSATLTTLPSSGTAYAVDDLIGNAVVLSINNATTFTANNLTPNTRYYFFVFAFTTLQNCYRLTDALIGNIVTSNSPVCTPPSLQASNLTATNITSTSMDINFIRGNGDNILVIARANVAVNQNPIVGVNYTVGSQIGTGNFVVYNGPATSFNYASLLQSTTYYFSLYEYFNTDFCYNNTPLIGNFTTSCTTPINVTSLSGSSGNATVSLHWTNPSVSCFDEILVIASHAPILGQGSDYVGGANSIYASANQVVFRGIGSLINITGLTNGTMYYFKVFTRNSGIYSSGVIITATPFDPAAGFLYLYGNLHSHSSFSDGNKDNTALQPIHDYRYARDANCMDFLGISEHNHNTAGMSIANYPIGFAQANTVNGEVGPNGNSIVTLWGMEWGVISGGGHVLTYGFDDQLIGWEAGNYNVFCAKNDYVSLFNIINAKPNAFASLAHPNDTDFGNIATTYSAAADNAIVGVAMESGPAFSTNQTYSDFPTQLRYLNYYLTMLSKGYKLGPAMDGDNHNNTFGRQSANRTVVLASTKSRADIVSALKANRFYASNDCNLKIDFKSSSNFMGSSLTAAGVPTLTVTVTDPDAGDITDSIIVYGAKIGDPIPTAPIRKYANVSTAQFDPTDPLNQQPNNTTYYYFIIVRQADGNKATTAPIWYTRDDLAVPVSLINFRATYLTNRSTSLEWYTAQEQNSKVFEIERMTEGERTFKNIGFVNAKGFSNSISAYHYIDLSPVKGVNYYRLKMIDIDGTFKFSNIVSINEVKNIEEDFTIFPNPATTFVYINSNFTLSKRINWSIYENTGVKVAEGYGSVDKFHPITVNLNKIKTGFHILKVIDQNGKIATIKLNVL